MDLASIFRAVRPVHGGVPHVYFWGARAFWATGDSIAGDALGVSLWCARASFLFADGGRCGGLSVDRDVYPLRAFLGSAGGIVGL